MTRSLATAAPGSTPALSNWEDVRFFLAVARGGSFSRAARATGADQSTVSRRVAALEEALGGRLFERGPRSASPTALGASLLAPALAAEAAVLALADAARSHEQRVEGLVRVALTEGLAQHVVVPRVLPALLERHAGLSVALLTSDEAVDLGRHEADIALRFFRTPRGALVGQRVARLPLAPLVAPALRRRLRGLEAAALPWISYERPGLETHERRWLEQIGAPPPRLVCTSVETQIAAVRAGLGVGLVPLALQSLLSGLRQLDGVALPPLPSLELFIATRASLRRVPRVAAVYEALLGLRQALDHAGGALP